jgi:membrane-bound lytic murein transglycosylase F
LVQYGYLRGIEPYRYVRQILERYRHYASFVPSG